MTKHADLSTRLSYALAWVRGKVDLAPAAGIVLGSGLSGLADRLEGATEIPYEEIPGFPVSKVPGHRARLVVGHLPVDGGRVPVVAMQGRAHGYEGWSAADVAFGARVLCGLGVKLLLVTNAAGGVNPSLAPGDLVRIVDHLNLSGMNPLVGENDDRLGPRFPDLIEPYDRGLQELALDVALRSNIVARRGVYVAVVGPNLETRAEYRFLRGIGADVVGMSTVPEVLVAVHAGLKVLGFSIITDMCLPDALQPVRIEEIIAVANEAESKLSRVVRGVLERWTS